MSHYVTLDELKSLEGKELAPTDWLEIDQERIDQFAACTDDRQYIHVDSQRMKKSPIGSTIAHGFLSLSLLAGHGSSDWPQLKDTVMSLNYGLDRVRFISLVKVNSRVRFRTKIISIREKSPGHILVKSEKTLEIEGEEKPAMVAETLIMLITSQAS